MLIHYQKKLFIMKNEEEKIPLLIKIALGFSVFWLVILCLALIVKFSL